MWKEDGWGYLPPTQDVFDIILDVKTIVDPKRMLEIGFYAGHSTTYFAELIPDCEIISCFPDNHPVGEKYSRIMMTLYDNVTVYQQKSPEIYYKVKDKKFDLVFVDGNHDSHSVMTDTFVALELSGYVLYDNCERESVQKGLKEFIDEGVLELVSRYEYTAGFKGKKEKNSMELYLTFPDRCGNMWK
jgi:predicted O-methyltransferase YrrM